MSTEKFLRLPVVSNQIYWKMSPSIFRFAFPNSKALGNATDALLRQYLNSSIKEFFADSKTGEVETLYMRTDGVKVFSAYLYYFRFGKVLASSDIAEMFKATSTRLPVYDTRSKIFCLLSQTNGLLWLQHFTSFSLQEIFKMRMT